MKHLPTILLTLFVATSAATPFIGPVPAVMSALLFLAVYAESKFIDYKTLSQALRMEKERNKILSEKKADHSEGLQELMKKVDSHNSQLTAVGLRLGLTLGEQARKSA